MTAIVFDDADFDRVYPAAIRALSRRFWTPVRVAQRAATLLRDAGARRVLDVGSGVGKFALVAAATEPDLDVVGIEQRAGLVRLARIAALRLGIDNALFVEGDATAAPWRAFDGLYFFNPLAENLFDKADRIDDRVELSSLRFVRDLVRVEEGLRVAAIGKVVVTYHGSSTRIPTSFELNHEERAGSDWLRVWTKARASDDGSFFVEVGDRIVRWHANAAC
jgi:SAM-dependent methyltransferase